MRKLQAVRRLLERRRVHVFSGRLGDMGRYIAFDMGAESGRAVLGTIDGGKLQLEEIHRFPNTPVLLRGTLHWDILALFAEVKRGLSIAAQKFGTDLDAVGIDTWGVDFGLLAEDGSLLANPVSYRDNRTEGVMEKCFEILPREEMFRLSGAQLMRVNTSFQLLAMRLANSPVLKAARTLLMIGDLFGYFLTGRKVAEYTLASTSQLMDMHRGVWSRELFERLDLPLGIMPEILPSGTILGEMPHELMPGAVRVVAPACHDTASAVAAVPAEGRGWGFISCGTWSVEGAEIPEARTDEATLALGFANEGGVGGTIRILRNLLGLWVVQRCRRSWCGQGEDLDYAKLVKLADDSEPFRLFLNTDDPSFLNPPDMVGAIAEFCKRTGQKMSSDKGVITRAVLEGIAFRYRTVLGELEKLLGTRLDRVHIVGGGTRNELLCQFAASAMNRTVIAGPVEATSVGNVIMQAVATGELRSVSEGRALIRRSFDLKRYEPRDTGDWDSAYQQYKTKTHPA